MKTNSLFLKRKKLIDSIFNKGDYVRGYPLSAKILQLNEINNLNFVICVKKKYLPKAVVRNKIKRLLKNSIRDCLHELKDQISEHNKAYYIAIIYNSNIIYDFDYLKDKINLILMRLISDE